MPLKEGCSIALIISTNIRQRADEPPHENVRVIVRVGSNAALAYASVAFAFAAALPENPAHTRQLPVRQSLECLPTDRIRHGPALTMEFSGVRIHATAIIDPRARIAPTATIGPFCVLGTDVVIGPNVRIDSHAVIEGDVIVEEGCCIGVGAVIHGSAVIGSSTCIFPYAIIGQTGQFPDHHNTDGSVEIESDCIIREFVIVNKSVTSAATRIGRGCYLMARTQIDHDCVLSPYVKTATGVTLGGSVHVEGHAYLGMNAVVHQGMRIGRACMIGMNGVVTAHVPPFTTLVDRRINRINAIGLARLGASEKDIARIEAFYRRQKSESPADRETDPWIDAIESFTAQVAPDRFARFSWAT